MKAKEVILLILIILIGAFFTLIYNEELDFEVGWGEGWIFGYEEFVFQETEILEAASLQELHIQNSHGAIEVLGTDKESITIAFEKRIWRKDEADAREVADRLKITIEQNGQILRLSSNRKDFKRKNFETHYFIEVPEGMDLNIANSYGSVRVEKAGKAEITNRYGKVLVSDTTGDLVLFNSYDDIEIEHIASSCMIEGTHADISIRNVQGRTDIRNSYGNLVLENILNDVTIRSPHSKIDCLDIRGTLDIESSYEKIELSDVASVEIDASQSPIQIDGAEGSIKITNRYSRVRLKNIRGNVYVEGKNLGISGNAVQGEKITIHSSYEDIEFENFSGETSITLAHGEIHLTPSPLTHSLEVKGSHADIKFFWPEGRKYPVDIQAKQGQIFWKLDEDVSFQKDNGLSQVKAFTEESGKPTIMLSTDYGTIWIEKSITF